MRNFGLLGQPVPTPAPATAPAPAPAAQPQGFGGRMMGILSGLGSGIQDFLDDDEKRARLVIALNSMRLNPDPNLARAMQSQMETAQATRLLKTQSNQTAAALRAAAQTETNAQRKDQLTKLADYIDANPANTEAPKLAVQYLANPMHGLPEGFQTKHMSAVAAGLTPGTDEYNRFMGRKGTYGGAFAYSKDRYDAISGIRKEFQGIKEVKDFQSQVSSLGRVMSSAQDPSAAGDLALIFNYMKMLDPGSTVRETEFANAQNAGGVDDRVRSLWNSLKEGQRLTPNQRADFTGRALTLYEGALKSYEENYEKPYLGYIKGMLNPEDDPAKYLQPIRFRGETYTPDQVLQLADAPPAGFPKAMWDGLSKEEKDLVNQMNDIQRARFIAAGNQ